MGKYVGKRILMAILTVFIISVITFFAMNAIPGGPFNKEKASSPAVIAAMEARYNLDKPVAQRVMQNLLSQQTLRDQQMSICWQTITSLI